MKPGIIHGFFSSFGKEEDLRKADELKNLPLKTMLASFKELVTNPLKIAHKVKKNIIDSQPYQLKIVDEYYKKLPARYTRLNRKINKFQTENPSMGDFFTWLWQNDPYSYIEIKELLLPQSSFSVFPKEHAWLYELQLTLVPLVKYL